MDQVKIPTSEHTPDPGCPGCGIRRTDYDRVRQLEIALHGLLDEWTVIGSNAVQGPAGRVIVSIDCRRVCDAKEALGLPTRRSERDARPMSTDQVRTPNRSKNHKPTPAATAAEKE